MAHSYAKFSVFCDTSKCGGSIEAYVMPEKFAEWRKGLGEFLEKYGWEVSGEYHYCPKCFKIHRDILAEVM